MDQKRSYHPGKWITLIGFCTAMEIILARFLSLHTWNLKIGLSFLPVAAAAPGGLTGALGDLIGAILFPVGPYFPGFTLSSFLDGYLYGLIFRRSLSRKAILLAVFLTQVGISFVLNTYWLSVLFHTPMMNLLYPRLFQCAVGVVTKTILLSIVLPPLK